MTAAPGTYNYYSFSSVQTRYVNPTTAPVSVSHPIGLGGLPLAALNNEGRYITGKDRQGDEYTLTVHGPGSLIVTDATPNDGSLDDDIDTIQIVGSNPHTTYVTGQVTATARPIVDSNTGIILFNHLIAQKGVQSIILNGFTLTQTVPAPAGQVNNASPAIQLLGGVHKLSFNDIINVTDLAGNGNGSDAPMNIIIGNPNTPMKQSPTIILNHIYNTVIDSTASTQEGLGPRTDGTVNFLVNGNLHNFSVTSATAQTITGGYAFSFPLVDVTGRTAVRATGVDHLKVVGSARNTTVSRSATAFSGSFSGVSHLGTADFGGTADAVGLDVKGKVGRVRFLRGAGSAVGKPLNPTEYGFNAAQAGYPSRNLTGALVTGNKIGKVVVGPSNLILETGQDPDNAQLQRQGQTSYYARPGQALVNAAIVSAQSIGSVNQVGLSQSSEIAAGYHYRSYTAGLEPVRAAAKIGKFRQRGDLIDSVVSATVRPNDNIYGNGNDTKGPGKITGNLNGRLYNTGAPTVLGNYGAGIYAKKKVGHLPPPEGPLRTKNGRSTR